MAGHGRLSLTALTAVLVLSAAVTACGPPVPMSRYISDLSSANKRMRAQAAAQLRTDVGVPASAVCPLIEALVQEPDEDVSYEMLRTLGVSGAPEALPYIALALESRKAKRRHEARHALRDWLIAQRRLKPNQDLDDIGL